MAEPRIVKINEIKVDNVNGSYARHRSGIFLPSKEVLAETLANAKVPANEKIAYVPQGCEFDSLEIARKTGQAVLLAGPTGVGKSMLARYMAQKWGLPYLWITCDPDKTEGKLMGRADLLHITVEMDGTAQGMQLQVFRPSAISIAGLASEPVVLFIDELHKLRRDIDSLFHPLVHERYVNLTDHLGPGETYKLHPETIVMFALNPYYEGGGIEKVGPAMRQRMKTLYFQMVTSEGKLFDIVRANVEGIEAAEATIRKICDMCASICRLHLEFKKEGSATTKDAILRTELNGVLPNLSEAPSPRVIVNAARAIVAGQKPADAVRECVFNAITNDFGQTAAALVTMAENRFGFRS